MILIFDLDDTLYEESSYVRSGLRAVARYGQEQYGLDAQESFESMYTLLLQKGRGRVFDDWLLSVERYSKKAVKECLRVYRQHDPVIKLPDESREILEYYQSRYPLYLVTDGHKNVQQKKIEALNIGSFFKRVLITHRFGIKNAKPSLYCFELIRRAEKTDWNDIVYVGDNPAKDFVNLNEVGAKTVRVLTGAHADIQAKTGHDAQFSITELNYSNICLLEEYLEV
jgi:putative hydrolase of the HAD superfamily